LSAIIEKICEVAGNIKNCFVVTEVEVMGANASWYDVQHPDPNYRCLGCGRNVLGSHLCTPMEEAES